MAFGASVSFITTNWANWGCPWRIPPGRAPRVISSPNKPPRQDPEAQCARYLVEDIAIRVRICVSQAYQAINLKVATAVSHRVVFETEYTHIIDIVGEATQVAVQTTFEHVAVTGHVGLYFIWQLQTPVNLM